MRHKQAHTTTFRDVAHCFQQTREIKRKSQVVLWNRMPNPSHFDDHWIFPRIIRRDLNEISTCKNSGPPLVSKLSCLQRGIHKGFLLCTSSDLHLKVAKINSCQQSQISTSLHTESSQDNGTQLMTKFRSIIRKCSSTQYHFLKRPHTHVSSKKVAYSSTTAQSGRQINE